MKADIKQLLESPTEWRADQMAFRADATHEERARVHDKARDEAKSYKNAETFEDTFDDQSGVKIEKKYFWNLVESVGARHVQL